MCRYVCHIFPVIASPWWWQCMTLNEYFSHCRFWFSGLWTLDKFGDTVADLLDACFGHGPALQGSSSPISMTSGKGSLSLIALSFFFLPFLLSSELWILGLFIPQVPCRLSLSSYSLFSLTHSQHWHLYLVTLPMNKWKKVPAFQMSRSNHTNKLRNSSCHNFIPSWRKIFPMPLRYIWLELYFPGV